RGGRRLPFLFFFTALCIVASALIAVGSSALGLVFFIVANFGAQAALIYYDATLRVVSLPPTRGRLSGIGVAVGYLGTIFVGLLIFFADLPVEKRFAIRAVLFALFALPIFIFVKEDAPTTKLRLADVASSW